MPTRKQIAANRANARKSTGPRSVEGKAVSSQNALKSGIDAQAQVIRGEDPAALEALTRQYLADCQPQSAAERALLDVLIDSEWTLRRLRKVEAQLWEQRLEHLESYYNQRHPSDPLPTFLLGEAFVPMDQCLGRLARRLDLVQRGYQRALHDLRELQEARLQPPIAAQPELPRPAAVPPTPSSQKPNRTNGFVPENPLQPGPAAPSAQPSGPSDASSQGTPGVVRTQ